MVSRQIRFWLWVAALAVLLGTQQARAADDKLASRMEAFLVTQDQATGKELLKPTDKASPGDTIEYRLSYTNLTASPLQGLSVVGPIPASTHYVAGSAGADVKADFSVSIDGGAHWDPEPVKRMRSGEDGKQHEVTVPADEYTQLRWQARQAMGPHGEQHYHYRVKVVD